MGENQIRNILVTGASGQLGRSLAALAGEYPQYRFVFPEESRADITDAGAIGAIIAAENIDAIINCAAYTAVERAEDDPGRAMLVNGRGPEILASLCRERAIPLVHFSTDYVFNGRSERPYREDDPVEPLSVYGRTKLAGERAVEASGCDAVVIRTSWVYSSFGNNFVDTMLRLASERDSLAVVADQHGTPTYAVDLARAALYLLTRGIAGFDTVHYSALGETTWYGFAAEIFRMTGVAIDLRPVTTEMYPTKAVRPVNSVMCMAKAVALGVPIRDWHQALGDCLGEMGKIKK